MSVAARNLSDKTLALALSQSLFALLVYLSSWASCLHSSIRLKGSESTTLTRGYCVCTSSLFNDPQREVEGVKEIESKRERERERKRERGMLNAYEKLPGSSTDGLFGVYNNGYRC